MKNAETNIKKQISSVSIDKNLKRIKNHRKAAKHLQAASKFHLQAATQYEEGHHQKAEQSTIAAHGQVSLSNKAQKAGIEHQAILD
ncbi:hypothetical protein ACS386_08630 [Flavobacteriaceae bacterium LMO-SS05]